MDAGFVNAYLIAVKNVFRTMFGVEIAMGRPALKTNKLSSAEITGMIGFAGDKRGNFSLAITTATAAFMYKTMVGETITSVTPELVDAIGEITNIISGQFRVEIEKLGYKLSAALPTVVVGHNVEINFITKVPVIALPFSFQVDELKGELFLDFSFE
jgi:chemotaxis protein CheX